MYSISKFLLGLLLLLPFFSDAQSYSKQNDQHSCFEWSFGSNYTHYNYTLGPKHQTADVPYDTFTSITNSPKLGFTAGILKNFMIGGRTIIRPGIKLAHYKSKIIYTTKNEEITPYKFNAVVLEAPLHWIQPIKATPGNGKKHSYLYTLFGGTFVNEIEVNDDALRRKVQLKNHDITLDLGLGARLYANKKHLGAVEVKYSIGLTNLYLPGYDLYQGSLEKATRNSLSIAFNFS